MKFSWKCKVSIGRLAFLLLTASVISVQIDPSFGQRSKSANGPTKVIPPSHYDVVSIRLADPAERGLRIGGASNTFEARNVTIELLLENTYNLREGAITGIPTSLRSTRFDISAKLLDASPDVLQSLTGEQRRAMLESLLRDRFNLRSHEGTKISQVFLLEQTKATSKFRPASSPLVQRFGMEPGAVTVSRGHLVAHAVPITSLVGSLVGAVQHDVIDQTNLNGLYDIDLRWDPSQGDGAMLPGATSSVLNPAPSLFTALQEQLGLRLVPAKRPVPVLIVDHVELPSAN